MRESTRLLFQWVIASLVGFLVLSIVALYSLLAAFILSGLLLAIPQAFVLHSLFSRAREWIAITWSGVFLSVFIATLLGGMAMVGLVDGLGLFVERYEQVSDAHLLVAEWWLGSTLIGLFGGMTFGAWQYAAIDQFARPPGPSRRWWPAWSFLNGLAGIPIGLSVIPTTTARHNADAAVTMFLPLLASSLLYALLTGGVLVAMRHESFDGAPQHHTLPNTAPKQ